jgi:hypothetical protein
MKILMLANVFFPDTIGGSSGVAYHLSHRLCKKNYEVYVLTRDPEGSLPCQQKIEDNLFTHPFNLPEKEGLRFFSCDEQNNYREAAMASRKPSSTLSAAKIKLGIDREIRLENPDTREDWGQSRDYGSPKCLILQQGEPENYLIASGECPSVKSFLYRAFSPSISITMTIPWSLMNSNVLRAQCAAGCFYKARLKMGWITNSSFEAFVRDMVARDL